MAICQYHLLGGTGALLGSGVAVCKTGLSSGDSAERKTLIADSEAINAATSLTDPMTHHSFPMIRSLREMMQSFREIQPFDDG